MSLIVQKFGGSSVSNINRVFNVAKIITQAYSDNNDIVAVVSAQGDTTDNLINKALRINKHPSRRELDVLLSTGEQISMALLAMAIERLGYPVISLLGWQAGFKTCDNYGNAKITKLLPERIEKELNKKKIVIIAGFQGINSIGDITTMGRGGSDTSAVAIAAIMKADYCKIYTDVEGIYTADPRIVPNAKKIDCIGYDEMFELSTLGAQVLHSRSIEIAKQYKVKVEVLSSLKDSPGTVVKEINQMESKSIKGLASDKTISKITIIGIPKNQNFIIKLFETLSADDIKIDTITQSYEKSNKNQNSSYLSFTVNKNQFEDAVKIINDYIKEIPNCQIIADDNIAKLSVVGTGIEDQAMTLSKILKVLHENNIKTQSVSTSSIRISALISADDLVKASTAIHNEFFPPKNN